MELHTFMYHPGGLQSLVLVYQEDFVLSLSVVIRMVRALRREEVALHSMNHANQTFFWVWNRLRAKLWGIRAW